MRLFPSSQGGYSSPSRIRRRWQAYQPRRAQQKWYRDLIAMYWETVPPPSKEFVKPDLSIINEHNNRAGEEIRTSWMDEPWTSPEAEALPSMIETENKIPPSTFGTDVLIGLVIGMGIVIGIVGTNAIIEILTHG